MNHPDIINTLRWTWGACVLWNQLANQFARDSNELVQFARIDSSEFQDFVHRTHSVIYRYLQGQQTLNGSCSDLECTLALEAKELFGVREVA